MNNKFGPYLRLLLAEKNWTQGQLAKKSGVATSTISRAISAKYIPEPETLKKLADALNTDFYTLMVKAGHIDESIGEGAMDRADGYNKPLSSLTMRELEEVLKKVVKEELEKRFKEDN